MLWVGPIQRCCPGGRHQAGCTVLVGSPSMKTTHDAGKMKSALAGGLRVSGLCLLAVLAAACSVDVGKLRVKASLVPDAAMEHPLGAGGAEVGAADADGDGGGGGVDTRLFVLDGPGADEQVGRDEGADLPDDDAAADAPVAEDLPDSDDAPADVPLAPADGGDSASGSGGGAGEAGMGGSGGGAGEAGLGGSGGSGGDGGNGGAGGTGGTGVDSGDGVDGGGSGGMDSGFGGTGGTGGSGGAGGGTGGHGGTGGTGGAGGTGGTSVDPDLVLWYRFDESSGTVAADSSPSGAGARDGTLGTAGVGGNATFSADCQVGTHALRLTTSSSGAAGGYVTTPSPGTLAPGAITIAVWVRLAAATSTQNWERIFDFGSGSGTTVPYFYLAARTGDADAPPRAGISNIGHSMPGEQDLAATSTLTPNVWHHIAVVLPAGATYTGVLYIDGAVAATNNAMTLHLSDVGSTSQNWLGRSPFTQDPLFSGALDDFRIYRRALSAEEIAALMALR
jgi:hypothetical protein